MLGGVVIENALSPNFRQELGRKLQVLLELGKKHGFVAGENWYFPAVTCVNCLCVMCTRSCNRSVDKIVSICHEIDPLYVNKTVSSVGFIACKNRPKNDFLCV